VGDDVKQIISMGIVRGRLREAGLCRSKRVYALAILTAAVLACGPALSQSSASGDAAGPGAAALPGATPRTDAGPPAVPAPSAQTSVSAATERPEGSDGAASGRGDAAAPPATGTPISMPATLPTDPAPGPASVPAPAAKSNNVVVSRTHLPHDLSPLGMFLAADIVVKGVMTFLALASFLVWTAWIGKVVQIRLAKRHLKKRAEALSKIPSLDEAPGVFGRSSDVAVVMAAAARAEVDRSQAGGLPAAGIKERVASELARIEHAAGRAMNRGTGILATVGGTAPFIGLFGTVWGIMNSFIGISRAQTTNLAVVAPGIAEALLATAIGLVAAIPAVIFYNQLARAITEYRAELADFGASLERLVSRDLDRRDTAASRSVAPTGSRRHEVLSGLRSLT